MVKHVILWKLKEEYSEAEKESIKAGIKEGLEGLAGQIPGLVEIHVYTEKLPSSNMDLMLIRHLKVQVICRGTAFIPSMWLLQMERFVLTPQ